jgi:hypothetical protein
MADIQEQNNDPIFANIQTPTIDDIKSHIETLLFLGEGLNGENEFNTEKAAYGYIEHHFRIVIPKSMQDKMPIGFVEEIELNPIEQYTIMFWNFLRLKRGGVDEKTAFFIAAYRARLIKLGYLYKTREQRAVTVDEVDYLGNAVDFHQHGLKNNEKYKKMIANAKEPEDYLNAYIEVGDHDQFKKFIKFCCTEDNLKMMKHLVFCASQYAAATYLVFRQHGHHYQQDLRQKYEILWRATTLPNGKDFGVPDHEMIHRAAIHSFGVKVLHQKFYFLKRSSKLAETFIDRSDVAPCGSAMVSTCYATINLLKSLPIWESIYRAYKVQIDALTMEAVKLKDAEEAIKYHKNAKLFGVIGYRINTDVASSLAPVAKGFIDSLGADVDLAKQKTLNKRANQNPVVVSTISKIIRGVMNQAAREGDIDVMAVRQIETAKEAKGEVAKVKPGFTEDEDGQVSM